MLPFVLSFFPATDVDLYLAPRSEGNEPVDVAKDFATLEKHPELKVLAADMTMLFYYINKLTDVHHLCIPPFVTSDIFAKTHGEDHSGFAQCYKIISCS